MKNGVPWDIAFSLDDVHSTAASIVMAQFEGQKFNWNSWDFEKQK